MKMWEDASKRCGLVELHGIGSMLHHSSDSKHHVARHLKILVVVLDLSATLLNPLLFELWFLKLEVESWNRGT
jgi:hypothetical protein